MHDGHSSAACLCFASQASHASPAAGLTAPGTGTARGVRYRGGLSGVALRRVLRHIEENLGAHLSLETLAAIAGVSRFHFARQFRVSTGESPMACLRRMRIDRAKAILRGEGPTIAQVAMQLGFADQSHFTRTFARMVGMPPRMFATLWEEPRTNLEEGAIRAS